MYNDVYVPFPVPYYQFYWHLQTCVDIVQDKILSLRYLIHSNFTQESVTHVTAGMFKL